MSVQTLPARVRQFYERVSVERDAALPALETIYASDVHFINPVVDQHGLASFTAVWRKALKMYARFEFDDIVVTGTDETFTLTYSMNIRFAVGPTFRTDMTTVCRGRDGRVYYCRDYFDPLGTLVRPLGPLAWLYRVIFRRLVA
jgi:limonene-1,2-epoxide hydrolase